MNVQYGADGQLSLCSSCSMSVACMALRIFLVCSISVPSMASKSLLVTAGNMARDHEMRITFLGMHAAAAGLALQERRWFHISKACASRCPPALLICPNGNVPACQLMRSCSWERCGEGWNDIYDLRPRKWHCFKMRSRMSRASLGSTGRCACKVSRRCRVPALMGSIQYCHEGQAGADMVEHDAGWQSMRT